MSEAITFKNSEGVISLKSPVVCNACNGVDYAPCCDNGENLADQIYALEQELSALRAQEQNEPVLAYDSGETDTELGDVFICSNCEGRIYVIYGSENNYCPKCGKPITFDEDYAHDPKGADK